MSGCGGREEWTLGALLVVLVGAAVAIGRELREIGKLCEGARRAADDIPPGAKSEPWRLQTVTAVELLPLQHFGTLPVVLLAFAMGAAPAEAGAQWRESQLLALRGQHDSVRMIADSIARETCRGGTLNPSGTCSGRKLAPRTSYLFRWSERLRIHADRADSLGLILALAAGTAGPAVSQFYSSGVTGFPIAGADTVTVCALVHFPDHSEKVGYPPAWLKIMGDSARLELLTGARPLRDKCAMLRDRNAMVDSVPVAWSMRWLVINGRRVYRPGFVVP